MNSAQDCECCIQTPLNMLPVSKFSKLNPNSITKPCFVIFCSQ